MGIISNWMSADKWVRTGMGPAIGGTYQVSRTAFETWEILTDPDTSCDVLTAVSTDAGVIENTFTNNYVSVVTGLIPKARTWENNATVSFELLQTFGLPWPLASLPDGAEILEARAEISCAGLTRTVTVNGTVVSTAVTDISYSLVGLTGPDSWETIGSVTGAADGIHVVDVTALMQTMFTSRASGLYAFGYGLIAVPDGTSSGELAAMVPAGPPGTVQVDDTSGCGYHTEFTGDSTKTTVEWDSASFGTIMLKVRYPDAELARRVVMPQLPPMV